MPGKQALASLLYKVVSISSYLPTPPTHQHTHPTACGNFTLVHLINQGPDILDGIFKVPWSQGYTGSPWKETPSLLRKWLTSPCSQPVKHWPVKTNPSPGGRRSLGEKAGPWNRWGQSPAKTSYQGGLSWQTIKRGPLLPPGKPVWRAPASDHSPKQPWLLILCPLIQGRH